MNATITYQTHLAAATEKGSHRYALSAVKLSTAGELATATVTDGRILAVVPVTHKGDKIDGDCVLVPAEVFHRPTARKAGRLALNGRAEDLDKGKVASYADGRYPDVKRVMPECKDCLQLVIDAASLKNLSDALNSAGQSSLTLLLPQPNKAGQIDGAIGVLPSSNSNSQGLGIIMPLACRDDDRAAEYRSRASILVQ